MIYLETGWAPVDKLDGSFGFNVGNGGVNILGDNISSVQEAASHVLTVTGITFHHLIGWFKASVGNFRNGKLLVISFFSGDNRRVGGQGEVNTGIWDLIFSVF